MTTDPEDTSPERPDSETVLAAVLTYAVLPAWAIAGLLDWYWHRTTKIECTSGTHESLTHLLMALEGGLGIGAGLVFEIDAGVIALMLLAAILHEATVIWDVGYTIPRRTIAQREQHTHSFMEALPFAAVLVAAALDANKQHAVARFAFRLKKPPLPALPFAVTVAASGLVGVLPHVEEFVRCWRTAPTLAPLPVDATP